MIAIDLGEKIVIKGVTYLPRQHGSGGIVDQYRIDLSIDGVHWSRAAEGEFANIRSNPLEQTVPFSAAVEARYIRFTALHVVDGQFMSVAELGVVVK